MSCKQFFVDHEKKLIYLSFILIGVGLIANFISTIIWWVRIQPWLLHSKHPGKIVNISTFICWILSLFCIILMTVFLIKFRSEIHESFFNSKSKYFQLIIYLLSILGSISGIVSSFYALKNDKISLGKFGKLNNKCYNYVLQYSYIKKWAIDHQKEKEFETWYNKLMNKISKCHKNDCDYKNPYNEYLCKEVGIPTLIFACVQIFGISLLLIIFIIHKKSNENFTLFENEQN